MGYRFPCGDEDRGPTGSKYPFTTQQECLSEQKRQGGGKRPSRKYKKSAKRVFRKKSRSTRRR